MMMKA